MKTLRVRVKVNETFICFEKEYCCVLFYGLFFQENISNRWAREYEHEMVYNVTSTYKIMIRSPQRIFLAKRGILFKNSSLGVVGCDKEEISQLVFFVVCFLVKFGT